MTNRLLMLLVCGAALCSAQMTAEQKLAEFDQLAGLFAKSYGPHEWKKQAFGIDLYDTAEWRSRIQASRTDPEYLDVMTQWVAQLNDAHDSYSNSSNFVAQLHFTVDLYDGRLLVDSIDRTRLPAGQFPIVVGYELVSIDGVEAMKILESFMPYSVAANERSTRRAAAEMLTFRPQSVLPGASSVPVVSTVVFRRFDGGLETYRMLWARNGVPLTSLGVWPGYRGVESDSEERGADAAEAVNRLLTFRLPRDRAILNFGSVAPVFSRALPSNFVVRLGRGAGDPFYSGTFEAGGFRIGYLRIPTFAPSDLNGALTIFVREIAFHQENTDGLIVDVMRNGGGSASYASALMSYLMYYRWRTMGVEIRATSAWIRDISSTLVSLRSQGAPASLLRGFEETLAELLEANRTSRGMTRPVPWDFNPGLQREPIRDQQGNPVAYAKPMLMVTDEFSASAADGFAAMFQDNGRGLLFGWRTMGAGGNVTQRTTGAYSRSSVSITESLMSRAAEREFPDGYPRTRYVENTGVHPDIMEDYMTAANLRDNGRPFVEALVRAMVEQIQRSR